MFDSIGAPQGGYPGIRRLFFFYHTHSMKATPIFLTSYGAHIARVKSEQLHGLSSRVFICKLRGT